MPTEVRDEITTFEAKVVPESEPAGAVPEIFPVKLPVRLPKALVKKRFVVDALVAKKLVVVAFVLVELKLEKLTIVEEALGTNIPPVSVANPTVESEPYKVVSSVTCRVDEPKIPPVLFIENNDEPK